MGSSRFILATCLVVVSSNSACSTTTSLAFLGTRHKRMMTTGVESKSTLFLKQANDDNPTPSDLAKRQIENMLPKQFRNKNGGCQCCKTVSPRVARVKMPVLWSMFPSKFLQDAQAEDVLVSKSSFDESARFYFPGSAASSRVSRRIVDVLSERNYTPSNTLYGTSICPDEINAKPLKSLSTRLQQSLVGKQKSGGVFNLGGLGGLPFVGQAGMQAFLSHSPAKGKVFVFFGPHVGITNDGVVGKVERVGQESTSAACGAVVGAYKELLATGGKQTKKKESLAVMNYQEDYLVSRLRPNLSRVQQEQDEDMAIAMVTTQVYSMVKDMLMDELQTCWQTSTEFWDKIEEVTLLGGIVINRGQHGRQQGEDYFQPLMFESWTKPLMEGAQPCRHDLYLEAFDSNEPALFWSFEPTTTTEKNMTALVP